MAREPAPIDIRSLPGLAAVIDEMLATCEPRRIVRDDTDVAVLVPISPRRTQGADAAGPPDTEAGDVIAELERRRKRGLSVIDMTAGILSRYAKVPPPTPREESMHSSKRWLMR